MNDDFLVDLLESVWRSTIRLCSDLTTSDWKKTTDCPGWSVQDNLSHLVGIEHRLLNRPVPHHKLADTDHVKNDLGIRNEIDVDLRRHKSGPDVLAEFRLLTEERLSMISNLNKDDYDKEVDTPIGPGKLRDLLNIRIVDCWIHEQDIRRATGKHGNRDGSVAHHVVQRLAMAMPYVVGKKVAPANNTTVIFDISEPVKLKLPIGMGDKRATKLTNLPNNPTVTLRMDSETFICTVAGRWQPETVLEKETVSLRGDTCIGNKILYNMNVMV